MSKEIIYIGDPMCSWCYAFSPVVQTLYQKYRDEVTMSLVVGGLHVGDNCINDDQRAAFLHEHWREIEERTGQPFKHDMLEERGWLYDTEPACRAVVTMRKLDPGIEFPYFATVQSGFYAENNDSNSDDTYADVAESFSVDREEFLATFNHPVVREETHNDFRWAQTAGIRGFPALLVRDDDQYAAVTLGYQPLEALAGPLEQWLRG